MFQDIHLWRWFKPDDAEYIFDKALCRSFLDSLAFNEMSYTVPTCDQSEIGKTGSFMSQEKSLVMSYTSSFVQSLNISLKKDTDIVEKILQRYAENVASTERL